MGMTPDWEALTEKIKALSPDLEELTAKVVRERAQRLGAALKRYKDDGKSLHRKDGKPLNFSVFEASTRDAALWEQACFETAQAVVDQEMQNPPVQYMRVMGDRITPISFGLTDVPPPNVTKVRVTDAEVQKLTEADRAARIGPN